jgi:hypothetical protein
LTRGFSSILEMAEKGRTIEFSGLTGNGAFTQPVHLKRRPRHPYSAPTQVSVAFDFFTVPTLSELELGA